jgi:ribosome-binding protein aMBF1 (putative translation factor)
MKACQICGKDLSKWKQLDFSKDIVCDRCIFSSGRKNKAEDKSSKEYFEISAVKKLCNAILGRKITSFLAIQCLEWVTGYSFTCTKDFRNKMERFFTKHYYRGADLRKARKWSGMDYSELADWFGVSIHTIKQMETNKKPLSQEAVGFIIVMGFKKTVPLKKKKKKASEPNCIQTTKIDKNPSERKLKIMQVSDQIKCEVCKMWKESWEVTIGRLGSHHTILICEDCLSKSKNEGKK